MMTSHALRRGLTPHHCLIRTRPYAVQASPHLPSLPFVPPKHKISPLIRALSRYYNAPPAFGIQGRYVRLIRELSELGDTVGVLDAHRALTKRLAPSSSTPPPSSSPSSFPSSSSPSSPSSSGPGRSLRSSLPFDGFQTLLHHFARIHDLPECFRLFHEAMGIAPDNPSLNDSLNEPLNGSLHLNGTLNKALKGTALHRPSTQERDGAPPPPVPLGPLGLALPVVHNAFLCALVEHGQLQACELLLAEMARQAVPWDEITYLLVARMQLESGSMDKLNDVLAMAREHGGPKISNTVYNYVLLHTEQAAQRDAIKREMEEYGIVSEDISSHPFLTVVEETPSLDTASRSPSIQQPSPTIVDQPLAQPLTIPTEPSSTEHEKTLKEEQETPSSPAESSTTINQPTSLPILQNGATPIQPITDVPLDLPSLPPASFIYPAYSSQYMYPAFFPYQTPYPDYSIPPTDTRILLQIPNAPSPLSATGSRLPKAAPWIPSYNTREEFHAALRTTTDRAVRRGLLLNMTHATIVPNLETLGILTARQMGNSWLVASDAWSDFIGAPPAELQAPLARLMVPEQPFEWKVVASHFQKLKFQSPLLYDELLVKTASPKHLQSMQELLEFMAIHNIAPTRNALGAAIVNAWDGRSQSLEDIFDWLGNRGVVLDQTLYTTLAYNIDYSKSRSARVKRSAILTLHRSMKQRRVLPDQAFFTAAFQSVMAANDHKSCALLLVSMKNAGVRLAQPLDAVLVVFLLRCGQIDMAEQVDEAVNSHSDELVQARYYAYLRARIDRGDLENTKRNSIIPAVASYYERFASTPSHQAYLWPSNADTTTLPSETPTNSQNETKHNPNTSLPNDLSNTSTTNANRPPNSTNTPNISTNKSTPSNASNPPNASNSNPKVTNTSNSRNHRNTRNNQKRKQNSPPANAPTSQSSPVPSSQSNSLSHAPSSTPTKDSQLLPP